MSLRADTRHSYNKHMDVAIFRLSVCVLLSGVIAHPLALADVKWGPAQQDLQLGIEWSDHSMSEEPAVRILLKNIGTERHEITTGVEGSAGPFYNVGLTALSDAQPQRKQAVFDLNALKARPSGFVAQETAHVEPGGVYIFTLPLSRLICVVDRKDVRLEDLVKRGYSIQASFEVLGVQLLTPNLAATK